MKEKKRNYYLLAIFFRLILTGPNTGENHNLSAKEIA